MMDFRDVTAENQIKGFSAYFDGVNFPAQPLSAESKSFFDTFFGGEGFISFCDFVFGPYHDKFDNEELCWMDYANIAPTQSVAVALSGLIHPNSTFVSTLEALSVPSATFAARLRKGWKNAAETRLESFLSTDLPLSAIYPEFYTLMTEAADCNLYSLSRAQVPPVLLVPFWDPPVVTRKELSQHQVLTCLPCSPMGYFIFRLLFFGMRRARKNCGKYLAQQRRSGVSSWMNHIAETAYQMLYKTMPVGMPYYTQLLQSYIQIYVSPSLPRHLSSKPAITDVTWTTNDTVAALLVMVPSLLAHRHMPQPLDENTRSACTSRECHAQMVSVVPLHTSMVYALLQSRSEAAAVEGLSTVPMDFPFSARCKAQCDLENIWSTLYRNCLILLRNCLLSFEQEPFCRTAHFTYCLELWAVLMNPFDKQQRPLTTQYVVHHFEVFSYIVVDVLNMIVSSSFCRSMNEESVKVLKRCFFLLSQETVAGVFSEVHAASSTSTRTVAEMVSKHFVLNWAGGNGVIQVPDLCGNTTCDLAARAYVVLERATAGDAAASLRDDMREALSFLATVFPNVLTRLDECRRTERASFSSAPTPPSRATVVAGQLSDSERSLFFKGGKSQRKTFAKNLRLPTHNGRVPGGHHPALQTSLRDEIPLLLGSLRFVDAILVKLQELYYWRLIPKCDKGHDLWLIYSKNYSCCNHPHETAIWECSLCEKVYGSCCRGYPSQSNGGRYLLCAALTAEIKPCSLCGQVVPDDCNLFYRENDAVTVLCPDCASRPFKALSVRFLASYTTWAIIIALIALYYTIAFLSR